MTALPTDVTDRAQIAAAKIDGARLGPVAVPMCNAGREGGGGILSDENVWRRSGSKTDKDSQDLGPDTQSLAASKLCMRR